MFSVVPLTAAGLQSALPAVVNLDTSVLQEIGRTYVDETWAESHFLADRPGKWRYSQLALDEERCPIGFWIASKVDHPAVGVYAHRVVVAPAWRNRGIAKAMLGQVVDACREDAVSRLSLSVSTLNEPALAFYTRAGFRRLSEAELLEFARPRGWMEKARNGQVVEPGGHCKFVLVYDLDAL